MLKLFQHTVIDSYFIIKNLKALYIDREIHICRKPTLLPRHLNDGWKKQAQIRNTIIVAS